MPADEELPLDMTDIRRWDDASPDMRAQVDQSVAETRELAIKVIGAARWHRDRAPHKCEPWCIGYEAISAIRSLDRRDLIKLTNFLVHLQTGGT